MRLTIGGGWRTAAIAGAVALGAATSAGAASSGQGADKPADPSGSGSNSSSAGQGTGTAQQPAARQQGAAVQGRLLDVEELNDDVQRYVGRRVSVAGEIQERLDPRSFILESGGLFDDEITVVIARNAKGIDPAMLAEDADVVVTGPIRQTTLVEIERELGWDLRPELEIEFDGTRTYLVAERISRQQDGAAARTGGPGRAGATDTGAGSSGKADVGDFSDTGATPGSPSAGDRPADGPSGSSQER